MNRQESLTRESRFTTRAKVLSVIFTVGIIALLAVRAPTHLGENAALSTPPVMGKKRSRARSALTRQRLMLPPGQQSRMTLRSPHSEAEVQASHGEILCRCRHGAAKETTYK
jgi:hypothetical protein